MTSSIDKSGATGPPDVRRDRARATLWGLALGDAAGMPSQTFDRARIARTYGTIDRLRAPCAAHPVAHGLRAGQVTDDTEQAMLLAHRLATEPDRFDERGWADDLLRWEASVAARGLRDLLGPSTKAALEALLAGESPAESGRRGTTNGAAMRIAPLGIATPLEPFEALLARVERVSRVTHHTGEAIGAAAAVAALVSAGIGGASFEAALPAALAAARLGQRRCRTRGEHDIHDALERALELAAGEADLATIAEAVGTSVAAHESVPAAFALARRAGGDAARAVFAAANIGDDTDTIGAIAGALCGACAGMAALPPDALARVRAMNALPIDPLVDALLAMRARPGASLAEVRR